MKKLLPILALIILSLVAMTACNKPFGGPDAPDDPSKQPLLELKEVTLSNGLVLSPTADRRSYAVSDYTGTDTSVTFPTEHEGVAVTSIGYEAFEDCTSLTSVTIPDSVTSIDNYAFRGCHSLTTVTIPDSVTVVGDYVFSGCTSLAYTEYGNTYYLGNENNPYILLVKAKDKNITSCTIHESTKFIYGDAFSSCTDLTSVTIPDSVTSIGCHAFACQNLTSVTMPDSITSIGVDAFAGCTSLTYNEYGNAYYLGNSKNPYVALLRAKDANIDSCTIHENTKVIHSGAFSGCRNLTSMTIPNSVKSLGPVAFQYCSGLTSVTIGDSVTSIGMGAFMSCSSLESVTVGNSVTIIASHAFSGCRSLTSVTVGNSVTIIAADAFNGCDSLTNVYITDLAAWCNIAFDDYDMNPLYYAHNLYLNGELVTDLVIPDSVTVIGDYAFASPNLTNVTNVTIPDSVKNIGDYAFALPSLTSLTIPDSVTSIGDYAFASPSLNYNEYGNAYYLGNENNPYVVLVKAKDRYITSCTIHENTKFIHSDAFFNCKSLTSVTIPDSVTSIGGYTFYGCASLTSVSIPDSVTSIGYYAFRGCSSLTSVTIPDSVTSIGYEAFYSCDSLTSVYYHGTEAEWGEVSIGSSNSKLTSATRYYYSETAPETTGNYWHYDENGNIVVWGAE